VVRVLVVLPELLAVDVLVEPLAFDAVAELVFGALAAPSPPGAARRAR
jgi:hypothetical protein